MDILEELEEQLAVVKAQIESAEIQLKSEYSESTFHNYLEGKLMVLIETEVWIEYMIEKVKLNG